MKKFLSFCLIALSLITPSFADNEADKKVVTSLQYVKDELNKKQDNIPAQTSGTYAVTYGTSTTHNAGEISPRQIKTSLGTNTSDTSLPTVGAVNTEINKKQDKIPAKDTNTVVTYTGTVGVVGEKGIYQDEGAYSAQMDNLVEAGAFNTAVKTGLDSEFLCAGNASGGDCWLWSIHNEGKSKNLLDDSFMDNSTYRAVTVNGVTTNYAKILPTENGKTYTLSATLISNGIYYYYLKEIYPDGTGPTEANNQCSYMWNNNGASNPNTTQTKTCRFTARNNATYLVYFAGGTSSMSHLTLTDYQMEEGSSATSYQPYMSPRPYTTLVPSDYTPVEYLESSGTQWIDTGYILTSSDVVYKWIAKDLNASGSTSLFGSEVNTNPKYAGILHGSNTGRSLYVGSSTGRSVGYKSNDGNFHSWVLDIKSDGSVSLLKDEAIVGTNTWVAPIQQSKSISVFSNNGKGQYSTVAFKSFSIVDNNTLVVNLIPARRNSDNVLGMYDTVSGTFKTNAGSGTFTAGPDISNVVYMPQEQ